MGGRVRRNNVKDSEAEWSGLVVHRVHDLNVAESVPLGSQSHYPIAARPLLVSRTSSPMTVMLSSRPTIRLVLPGIAPPAR